MSSLAGVVNTGRLYPSVTSHLPASPGRTSSMRTSVSPLCPYNRAKKAIATKTASSMFSTAMSLASFPVDDQANPPRSGLLGLVILTNPRMRMGNAVAQFRSQPMAVIVTHISMEHNSSGSLEKILECVGIHTSGTAPPLRCRNRLTMLILATQPPPGIPDYHGVQLSGLNVYQLVQ